MNKKILSIYMKQKILSCLIVVCMVLTLSVSVKAEPVTYTCRVKINGCKERVTKNGDNVLIRSCGYKANQSFLVEWDIGVTNIVISHDFKGEDIVYSKQLDGRTAGSEIVYLEPLESSDEECVYESYYVNVTENIIHPYFRYVDSDGVVHFEYSNKWSSTLNVYPDENHLELGVSGYKNKISEITVFCESPVTSLTVNGEEIEIDGTFSRLGMFDSYTKNDVIYYMTYNVPVNLDRSIKQEIKVVDANGNTRTKVIEDEPTTSATTEEQTTEQSTTEKPITTEQATTEKPNIEKPTTQVTTTENLTTEDTIVKQDEIAKQIKTTKKVKASISSVKIKRRKATIKVKNKIGYKYEFQYSTSSKFKSGVKSIKTTKTSYRTPKLKKNKKYYFRVRVYKKIDGKVYYGKWSSVKKVKIKK